MVGAELYINKYLSDERIYELICHYYSQFQTLQVPEELFVLFVRDFYHSGRSDTTIIPRVYIYDWDKEGLKLGVKVHAYNPSNSGS